MRQSELVIASTVTPFAMRNSLPDPGFAPPDDRNPGGTRRTAALAALIASLALAAGTVLAATVVTVGIANAGVVDGVVGHEGSLFGIALLLGLVFIGMSGLSFLPGSKPKRR
jgi:hypothetical protein